MGQIILDDKGSYKYSWSLVRKIFADIDIMFTELYGLAGEGTQIYLTRMNSYKFSWKLIRQAFTDINAMFTELYALAGSSSQIILDDGGSYKFSWSLIRKNIADINVMFTEVYSGSSWTLQKLTDGNTVAWYNPTDINGAVRDINGVESIYWDFSVGNLLRGAEQSSGVIIQYAVYEITTTQVDFFYAGCQVGDIFPCGVVKTCDANNKVKRVLGNHLTQPVVANRPINGIFDGVKSFMKTSPFNFSQPESIYMIMMQKSWVAAQHGIFDGNGANSGLLFTHGVYPGLGLWAGFTLGDNIELSVNNWGIVSSLINGNQSSLQIDDGVALVGNAGLSNMGGFTLGGNAALTMFTNIKVKEILLRKIIDVTDNLINIKSYFKRRKPTLFGGIANGALILTFDDYLTGSNSGIYDQAFPLFQSKGIKGSVFIPTDWITSQNGWVKIKEMQDAGWDICNHGKTHTFFDTLSTAQIEDEISLSQAAFLANGLVLPDHFGYPGGQYSITGASLNVIKNNFKTARRYLLNGYIDQDTDKFNMPSSSLVNSNYIAMQANLNYALVNRVGCILTTHFVYPSGTEGSGGIDVDNLETFINYAQSIGLPIITLSNLDDLFN